MKCLSIWQPWANAIALGLKRIETRSWAHPYRGEIAIHAAKNTTAIRDGTLQELSENLKDMTDGENSVPSDGATYPLGVVVAVAQLIDCVPTSLARTDPRWRSMLSDIEAIFGDYSDLSPRFGWLLKEIRILREPVPVRGMQGIFVLHQEDEAAVRTQLDGSRRERVRRQVSRPLLTSAR